MVPNLAVRSGKFKKSRTSSDQDQEILEFLDQLGPRPGNSRNPSSDQERGYFRKPGPARSKTEDIFEIPGPDRTRTKKNFETWDRTNKIFKISDRFGGLGPTRTDSGGLWIPDIGKIILIQSFNDDSSLSMRFYRKLLRDKALAKWRLNNNKKIENKSFLAELVKC